MFGVTGYVIIAPVGTVLIILFLLVAIVLAASFALGRATHEVESVRDAEYVELEGSWVRYSVIGGGPPVVLVHGWLNSSRVWEGLAGRLAQRFTVYTLDLTGFGDSDKPPSGYGVRYGSRLLYSFCAHFGLTRANVVGHDLGGDMVVKLAADHPDIVGRLVLVSTPADEDQIDLPTALWLATLPVVGPLFYALGRAARPVRRLWMRPFVLDPEDLTEEVIEDAGRSTPAAVAGTLNVARREISRGRLVRQARIIKIPALLVAGEDDRIVDPQAVGTWAESINKSEVCLIDGCGHLPMVERTAEFNAQVLAFLTGDARYLQYAQIPPAATTDKGIGEDAGRAANTFPAGRNNGEAPYGDGLYAAAGATDDTAELSPRAPEKDPGPETWTGRSGEPPNVIRKRDGLYRASNGQPQPPSDASANSTSGGDAMPELPVDLFDRSETRGGGETRRRYGSGASSDEPDDGRGGPPDPPGS